MASSTIIVPMLFVGFIGTSALTQQAGPSVAGIELGGRVGRS